MPPRSQLSRGRQAALHPALFLIVLAALIAIALWSVERFRQAAPARAVDLVSLLPAGDATTFFANLDLLRNSGYLQMFANDTGSDPDYRRFVAETNFDFSRDVNAVAGAWSEDQLVLLVKGRLDWNRFHAYVSGHGGHCNGASCGVAVSQPGRYLSFKQMQPDVMLAVIGPDANASEHYVAPRKRTPETAEHDPVYVRSAASLLQKPNALPSGLRMFAIALQSAQSVTISLAQSQTAAFDLKLFARFENPAVADTARNQLAIDTKSLALELGREHAPADPANLTGLLTSGKFWTQDKALYGTWPVRKEFLTALR